MHNVLKLASNHHTKSGRFDHDREKSSKVGHKENYRERFNQSLASGERGDISSLLFYNKQN